MKPVLAVVLAVLLPLVAVTQGEPPVPGSGPANSRHDEATETEEPAQGVVAAEQEAPPKVDPSLVNKKVVVHLRDGRVLKGKLVEITDDALHLKIDGRMEKVNLAQVAAVERQPSNRKKALIVIAAVVAVGFVVGAIIGTREPD